MDYFKEISRVKHTATAELRGSSYGGFIVDSRQIQPSFNEIWNGLTANVKAVERSTPGKAAKPVLDNVNKAAYVLQNIFVVAFGVIICAISRIFSDMLCC